MLSLPKRECLIGNSINTRAEKHGEEDVTALDIPLVSIMLGDSELNALMESEIAHAAWFDTDAHPVTPWTRKLKPYKFDEKIEGANVTLFLGSNEEPISLVNVSLRNLTLQPMIGGLTALDVQVQCTPDMDVSIAHLLGKLNATISVEISVEDYGAQAQLPLGQSEAA